MTKQAWGVALNKLLDGERIELPDRAGLRMVADDIAERGAGGPLETELHHASLNDPGADTREFARRLLGSVRKWNASRID